MDPLTRRSATLATIIHACLVGIAFMPRGCSETPNPTPPPKPNTFAQAPQPAPAQPSAKTSPQYGTLIPTPLTVAKNTALPALGAADLPAMPDLGQLISSVRQDHAAQEASRGEGRKGSSLVDLPKLPANPDDLIPRLQQGAVSNETLTREQRMLATTNDFFTFGLKNQIDRNWRHLLKQVTEPRLIIEIKVDKTGRLTYAQLANSSGSLTLDRLIQEWLLSPDFILPPIKPDILYPFLIVVRR